VSFHEDVSLLNEAPRHEDVWVIEGIEGVSGQLHVPAVFPSGKQTPVPSE